jgi:hypothetical protein
MTIDPSESNINDTRDEGETGLSEETGAEISTWRGLARSNVLLVHAHRAKPTC